MADLLTMNQRLGDRFLNAVGRPRPTQMLYEPLVLAVQEQSNNIKHLNQLAVIHYIAVSRCSEVKARST